MRFAGWDTEGGMSNSCKCGYWKAEKRLGDKAWRLQKCWHTGGGGQKRLEWQDLSFQGWVGGPLHPSKHMPGVPSNGTCALKGGTQA